MRVSDIRNGFEREAAQAAEAEEQRQRQLAAEQAREAQRLARFRDRSERAVELSQRFHAMVGPLTDLAVAYRGRVDTVGSSPSCVRDSASKEFIANVISLGAADLGKQGEGEIIAYIRPVKLKSDVRTRGVDVRVGLRRDDIYSANWDDQRSETYVDKGEKAGKREVNLQGINPWRLPDALNGDEINPRVLRRTDKAIESLRPACEETTEMLWDAATNSELNPDIASSIGPYVDRNRRELPYAAAIMDRDFTVDPVDLVTYRQPSF